MKQFSKLRVCMISYSFYESDPRVSRYAKALVEEGSHVDMIALRKEGQCKYERIDGVHLYRLQKRKINEKNFVSYCFRISKFFVLSMMKLTRLAMVRPYDVVHVHNIPDFLVFVALVPKLRKAKVILDIHDIFPEFFQSKFNSSEDSIGTSIAKFVERSSTRFADHIIVANHIWAERLISRGLPQGKCTALINYPDLKIFSRSGGGDNPNRMAAEFRLVYPGSLNWHQGLDIAVRAMPMILESIPTAYLHIYGDGTERKALQELSCTLNVDKRVVFHNNVPVNEIAGEIAKANVGIVPKRASGFGNEALSTKIMEYMSVGIPVIASDTTVERYYFDDSMVMFFKSGNHEELAKAVTSLHKNKELRIKITHNAMLFVNENDWNKKKNEYFSIIKNMLV
jgi:glycosyltransferase involved in cell wall biosynthesis